jgi:hypothetical protein
MYGALTFGMASLALAQESAPQLPSARQQHQHIHTPQSIEQELVRLTTDLQLTPQQQQQVSAAQGAGRPLDALRAWGLHVDHERALERGFVTLTSFTGPTVSITSQPVTIRYFDGRTRRRYTPDFLVTGARSATT